MNKTQFTKLFNLSPDHVGLNTGITTDNFFAAVESVDFGNVSSDQWIVDKATGALSCSGKDLAVYIEPLPYSDRGRFKVMVDWLPSSDHSIHIDWAGLSRCYYSLETCLIENDQWLYSMGQFIASPAVPNDVLSHTQEFTNANFEHLDGWSINLVIGKAHDFELSYQGKHCTCTIIPVKPYAGFAWRWRFDAHEGVVELANSGVFSLTVDDGDMFPRHYMNLNNALSEAKRWLQSRGQNNCFPSSL